MKMHPPVQPKPGAPLIDNMFAPEILAGGLSGLAFVNGIVTITLENLRADHARPDPALEGVVVGRVGMPVPVAQSLLSALYQFMSQHCINPLMVESERYSQ